MKEVISRPLYGLVRKSRRYPLTWRFAHNLVDTLRFTARTDAPRGEAARVVADLRRDGVALSTLDELLGPGSFDALAARVSRTEESRAPMIAAARDRAGELGSDDEKTYALELLGRHPEFDPSSEFGRIATHPTIQQIADHYFGLPARLRYLNVWHTLASEREARDSQLWHRDREDLRILKVFVYLVDVDEGNGPFTYARTTHALGMRRATKPASFQQKGIERSTDQQLARTIPPELWLAATGKKGTVVLADTHGYHKGGFARTADRILFTCMFTSASSQSEELMRWPMGPLAPSRPSKPKSRNVRPLRMAPIRKPRVLVLSSSLLTDRVFLFTSFLSRLAEGCQPTVWALSADPARSRLWSTAPCPVEPMPAIAPSRERLNLLRRVDERAWDLRLRPPSRLSMIKHGSQPVGPVIRASGALLAELGFEHEFESWLADVIMRQDRAPEARARLEALRPDLVLTTGPFQFEQPAIVAEAKKLGIPTMAYIPSWDNLSTKKRLLFKYDAYAVWSEQGQRELLHFYPDARVVPSYVIGAPQFDIFHQSRFHESRDAFCARYGFPSKRRIVLYAVGSPNFLADEWVGAKDLAERVEEGAFGDVQLVVRPHPIHDRAELADRLGQQFRRMTIQRTGDADLSVNARTQSETDIVEWVNSFRHADVVVNLASTVTVDAALFDKPVVSLNYDPGPRRTHDALIKDINTTWTHFAPVAASGGVWLTNDAEETAQAVRSYLAHPEQHELGRRLVIARVCQFDDGRSAERMAEAVERFARSL
ncbi:MAG: CDP-glycerol glycerophosphotransferase family protein [Deltaproteobacteria bacterium]|nr:CDP-glycerol glycerophosphotransferase family protein [Deltaproteobacteria bacterium]